jgi:hypothetical protein
MPGQKENGAETIDDHASDKRIDVLPLQPVKSILKNAKPNLPESSSLDTSVRRTISWQDFHGNQALAVVHQFEPRWVPWYHHNIGISSAAPLGARY